MAAVVTMSDLLKAGVHFGHQTRRWNPKMDRYLWGERNGIYIIDLEQTIGLLDTAYSFVRDTVAKGGTVLFVGTKKQAQDPIETYAKASGMPYVNQRWLGGMLTNFRTIRGRVEKMLEYERMQAAGDFDNMPKKEALLLERELTKLQRNLDGLRNMDKLPQTVFVLDTPKEHIAVAEANRLKLPVVAVADSNSDPDLIDYVIPGNDDAIRSTELLTRVVAEAVREGRYIAESKGAVVSSSEERGPEEETRVSAEQTMAAQKALAEAAAREARVAAEHAAQATPRIDAPPEAATTADEVAEQETSAEEPSETTEEN
ncbi:MAG: 30S ribosomal protein S2 [Actinomycetota bacterium]|nr:30S ribosomal protein S2 [Acidimicrobiales bacterium]MEC8921740.1 30S ribosomal protein S2 [Actinomycetota bacterium]MEE2680514.1 30S ribosomal protein S2 [Actinomycetota bacterium]MEE3188001.1 30S ribosomal protein S2 [Actinomycetota bacterium]|tara:strand:+ start:3615 stop:4559 length:945 start_codon:yes stop_codon:yes gene_type:complete